MKRLLRLSTASLLVLLAQAAACAEPTAASLLKTCEAALGAGYRGPDAAMCEWFVEPCAVCGPHGPPPVRWCLPPGEQGAQIARTVTAALHADPGLAARPAHAAVAAILESRFPCREAPRAGRSLP